MTLSLHRWVVFGFLIGPLLGAAVAVGQPVEPLRAAPRPEAPPAPSDVSAPPAQTSTTPSGLAWRVLSKGTGEQRPVAHDKVTVHYTGWTSAGELIDSSIPDGEPTTFLLSELLNGLSEGLQLMVKGEKRRLWLPAALATTGRPKRRGGPGPSVFDVELVDFVKMPAPIPVPEDLAEPPSDAKQTASGLTYRYLKRGPGRERPRADSTVEVHYSGWTLDGQMFDSSVRRGQPTSFPLNAVIKGWTEGVQLMVVGDKVRFWIPGPLAYGDKPTRQGTPAGRLVFDVELLRIK